jgi:hypothetical protein
MITPIRMERVCLQQHSDRIHHVPTLEWTLEMYAIQSHASRALHHGFLHQP